MKKNNKVNKKFINVLEVANAEKKEVIIMGDLNCNFSPGASWCQGETKKLKSILQSMNMTQVVNEPTRVTRESQTLILIDSVNVFMLGALGIMRANGGYVTRTAFRRVHHAYCWVVFK